MQVTAIKYQYGELIITGSCDADIERILNDFKPGEYKLTRQKEKRSTEQNKYIWELITQISEKVKRPKEEIYKSAVRDYGTCDFLTMPKEAIPKFRKIWEQRGLGWFVDLFDSHEETADVIAYYGSSVYDTAEMSRLIDGVIQEAKQVGIETLSERELSILKGGTMKSIMQTEKRCYLCGATNREQLDLHHIFSSSLRKKSDYYGLTVYLCHSTCHLNGAHKNPAIMQKLHEDAQRAAMQEYGWSVDDWRKHMLTKNFIEEEAL